MYTLRDIHGKAIATINSDSLTFARLACYDLTDADFRGLDLSEACLDSPSIKGADFRGANLKHAYLGDNTLEDCIIDETTVLPEEEEPEYHRPCWM